MFRSLRGYERTWLRGDAVAGVTVWAVLIPESLAYASIAGVSPVVGLYAAPAALILYAAFGSSRHLVVGPMSATAALSAATVADAVGPGHGGFAAATAMLALTTGAAAIAAGLLRLGFLASFISEPVIKGFIVGLAMTIVIGQVPELLGVEKGSGNFFEKGWDLLTRLGDVHGLTLAIGVLSLAAVLGLRRAAPGVPGSLVVVLLSIASAALLNLDEHGVELVGSIQSGLPEFGLPDGGLQLYGSLVAGGIGVMLVGFAEGLGAAKTYASAHHYEIDVERELIGLGAANVASGLSSGMVVNGSLSKTAVNGSAGAHSQLSGLVVAALTVVTLLLLTGLFEQLPKATLAAVVIAAVIELVDFGALRALYRVASTGHGAAARPDFTASIAALLGVLVFDTLPGLFIGIGVSLLLLLYRASRPHIALVGRVPGTHDQFGDVARHPENEVPPGVAIVRVDSGLFFANADHVRERMLRLSDGKVHAVILDAETVPYIDVTAAGMLAELAAELERRGVQLHLARDVGQVRDVLRKAGAAVAGEHVHPTVGEALASVTPHG
jgi:sulfate permease, SulP family